MTTVKFSAYGIFRKWNRLTLGPVFHYYTNFHYRKDESVKWSEVAGSGDTNIITTQCEAYATVNQGHECEVPELTGQQPHLTLPTAIIGRVMAGGVALIVAMLIVSLVVRDIR